MITGKAISAALSDTCGFVQVLYDEEACTRLTRSGQKMGLRTVSETRWAVARGR